MSAEVRVLKKNRLPEVWLSIDQQHFKIDVPEPTLERCRWYARQLRIALKRLEENE
jgi:hypothetical protein